MKARLPKEYQNRGANNMNSMIKQAQKMQEDIERVQAELEARDFTASAAGGMIEVTMSVQRYSRKLSSTPR